MISTFTMMILLEQGHQVQIFYGYVYVLIKCTLYFFIDGDWEEQHNQFANELVYKKNVSFKTSPNDNQYQTYRDVWLL